MDVAPLENYFGLLQQMVQTRKISELQLEQNKTGQDHLLIWTVQIRSIRLVDHIMFEGRASATTVKKAKQKASMELFNKLSSVDSKMKIATFGSETSPKQKKSNRLDKEIISSFGSELSLKVFIPSYLSLEDCNIKQTNNSEPEGVIVHEISNFSFPCQIIVFPTKGKQFCLDAYTLAIRVLTKSDNKIRCLIFHSSYKTNFCAPLKKSAERFKYKIEFAPHQ